MKDKEQWEDLGIQIKDLVEGAIDSNNFNELSKNINDAVNSSVNGIYNQIKNVTEEVQNNASYRAAGTSHRNNGNRSGSSNSQIQYSSAGYNKPPVRNYAKLIKKPKQKALIRKPRGKASAVFQEIFGYASGFVFLGSSLASLDIASLQTATAGSLVGSICFGLSGIVCFGLGIMGSKKRGQLDRFNCYIKALGNQLYYDIEDLAKKIGYSPKIVQKDIREMIHSGVFVEGHLDKQETCLMITDNLYDQYLETQKHYEEEQRQKQLAASARQAEDALSPMAEENEECNAILKEGNDYIHRINYCNTQIKDSQMTEKLNRLELVVGRIFEEIRKDPDKISDLHRMMNFYLPTTMKLVNAYCELENQPVAGENIESTKREIREALDTLNQAFEKLLDDLFQDTAWDIASDISVLETMLAQDGYMDNQFSTEDRHTKDNDFIDKLN